MRKRGLEAKLRRSLGGKGRTPKAGRQQLRGAYASELRLSEVGKPITLVANTKASSLQEPVGTVKFRP